MRIVPLKIESEKDAKNIMSSLNVCQEGIRILAPKTVGTSFKIENISSWEANIIKQQLLSLGSDAAINRDALLKKLKTNILIFGNVGQLRKLCDKLKNQPFSLREVSKELGFQLDNLFKNKFVFKARDKVLKIEKPVICGIINLTPDSFSGDGLLNRVKGEERVRGLALKQAEEMIKNGARILDLGGESSRPFSKTITADEEIRRVMPALKAIRKEFKKAVISIDTYKYKVALEAVEEGVDIINDITALRKDPKIAILIKQYALGCVLMHMKGFPETMQRNPKYINVIEDILDFFQERLKFASRAGIEREQFLLDPGIGFGKRAEDNLKIINELYKFRIFGLPVFLGLSRKSFISKVIDDGADARFVGSIAANIISVIRGVNILRVHDVKQTKQALKIVCQIMSN